MKIEVCESLTYSWFKHVKGCSVVQTNWSTSPCWKLEYGRFDGVCQEIQNFFKDKYGYTVFKGASTVQFIRQGEIDAVGIKIQDNQTYIYAADSAFHENGLNYGSADETVSRVLKKYFRTAVTLKAVYGEAVGEIAFISPKINKNILEPLETAIGELQDILFKNGFEFTLELYANDSFTKEVVLPVVEVAKQVSDDNELFLRSFQLVELSGVEPNNVEVHNAYTNTDTSVCPAIRRSSSYTHSEQSRIRIMFEEYLIKKKKKGSTVNSYCCSINKHILKRENLDWNTLPDHINEIVFLYDVGGVHQDIGQIGHCTVINALKRFREFVRDNNLGQQYSC